MCNISQAIKEMGIAEGKKQDIEKGTLETSKVTAVKMLKRGKLTVEEIAEDVGLSIEEVLKLKVESE